MIGKITHFELLAFAWIKFSKILLKTSDYVLTILYVQLNVHDLTIFNCTHVSFRVKFDEEFLPFEADFSDFGPGEGVDFGQILEDCDSAVDHR